MAGDAVFKKVAPTAEESAAKRAKPQPVDKGVGSTTTVEPPYLDYERENSHPYMVDYFGLGDNWSDPVGGFPKEIGIIEGYFRDRIELGDIANSSNTVKDELKKIMKLTGVDKEERALVKVETVAAYIKFLSAKEDIKRNIRRYGNAKS